MKLKRMRELREDNNLTQAQVGQMINVPQRSYAYYEAGKRQLPTSVLISIAKLYNVSADYILELSNSNDNDDFPQTK